MNKSGGRRPAAGKKWPCAVAADPSALTNDNSLTRWIGVDGADVCQPHGHACSPSAMNHGLGGRI